MTSLWTKASDSIRVLGERLEELLGMLCGVGSRSHPFPARRDHRAGSVHRDKAARGFRLPAGAIARKVGVTGARKALGGFVSGFRDPQKVWAGERASGYSPETPGDKVRRRGGAAYRSSRAGLHFSPVARLSSVARHAKFTAAPALAVARENPSPAMCASNRFARRLSDHPNSSIQKRIPAAVISVVLRYETLSAYRFHLLEAVSER
jgi:hypothetical protein